MSDKDLKVKVGQRKGVRLNVANEVKKGNELLAADAIDVEKLSIVVEKLRVYQNSLENLDNAIASLVDDANIDDEVSKTAVYNDQLLGYVLSMSQKCKVDHLPVADSASSAGGAPGRASVKLPKLQITKFSGQPLKWETFWDSFKTTIHDNEDLSDIDKFKYLKSFLMGDALRMVESYRLTAANCAEVIEAMESRFGNKQVAIFAHFEAMLAVPVSGYEISQLQGVNDECEKHIRSLIALGLKEETFEQVFTPILLSKLPKFIRIEMHRKNEDAPWTLANARKFLREEIRVREMSQGSFAKDDKNGKGDPRPKRDQGAGKGSGSFLTGHSSGNSDARVCPFCSGNHFADECSAYPDADARRKRMKGTCYACFNPNHSAKLCKSKKVCYHCKKRGHHRSLCLSKFGTDSSGGPKDGTGIGFGTTGTAAGSALNPGAPIFPHQTPNGAGNTGFTPATQTLMSHGNVAVLQTAVTRVSNPDRTDCSTEVRLLLDTGCDKSFVTTSVARKLRLKYIGEETLSISGFGASSRSSVTYKIAELAIGLKNGKQQLITVNVTSQITCPIRKQVIDVEKYPVIGQVVLAERPPRSPIMAPIDVLIGSDYYYDFVGSERIHCGDGLLLLASSFGYILAGKHPCDSATACSLSAMLLGTDRDKAADINFDLERFWNLEQIGIRDEKRQDGDAEALEIFQRSVQFHDGRYQVQFPWKNQKPCLADNYALARGRLCRLVKRLQCDDGIKRQYQNILEEQERKGIIEKAPETPTGPLVYYIPHHCVVNGNRSTTKVRIVYDASSKACSSDYSLNDCLHRGPVIMEDLGGLLIRFRFHAIAVISDIEKAYLQVGLQPNQRDVTRFLWLRDPNKLVSNDNLVQYRFARVPFGIIASAFLLGATVMHHLSKSSDPIASKIGSSLYVDNVVTGCSSLSDSKTFYSGAKGIFHSASMNLREWYSNSSVFINGLPEKDRGAGSNPKVLGLKWNTQNDVLHCFYSRDSDGQSKRQILGQLSSIYDPCGFVVPIVVETKILIHKLWKLQYDWDDALPQDLLAEWSKCRENLDGIPDIAVPRYLVDPEIVNLSNVCIHVFCDASAKAYGAAAYLVWSTQGTCHSHLLFAKSRVAPVKKTSIPRLELLAVLTGTMLLNYVSREIGIHIDQHFLWSDSKCVLDWIANERSSSVFVRNRVAEIKKSSNVSRLYVPSADNPADLLTRGVKTSELQNCSLWWNGPAWLRGCSGDWPDQSEFFDVPNDSLNDQVTQNVSESVDASQIPTNTGILLVVQADKFSSWICLQRVTAWVLRAVNNFKCGSSKQPIWSGPLNSAELENAINKILQSVQMQLHLGKQDKKMDQWQRQLGLYTGPDSLIRCKGRFRNNTDEVENHPILLPKNSLVTDLIIDDCHKRLMHAGTAQTLSLVRSEFWIIHGRSTVKRVLRNCRICRRSKGNSFATPPESHLPDFRIKPSTPFSYCGLDYMGPLLVKNDSAEKQKVWICLFTCASVRAIHLEVIKSLNTSDFLLAFRRFCASFGMPKMIICDNAPQFKAGQKVLDKLWNELREDPAINSFCTVNGIEWNFIPEFSPWMGGMYERMVGLVKQALKSALLFKCVSISELQTIVLEVTAGVNTRPLVYLDDEIESTPLTPAHFLMKHKNIQLPHVPSGNADPDFSTHAPESSNSLIQRWKVITAISNAAWSSWRNQYLHSLRERIWTPNTRGTVGPNRPLELWSR